MRRTLAELLHTARRRADTGDLTGALKVYLLLLRSVPDDLDLRMEVADVLLRGGHPKVAAAVYRRVAQRAVPSGDPFAAVVSIKALDALGEDVAALVDELAETYCAGSPRLGRSLRPAPADYDVEIAEDVDIDYAIGDTELLAAIAQTAAAQDAAPAAPPLVPPVPILSTLDKEAFLVLLEAFSLLRAAQGARVIEEGAPGDAVYFIAKGQVRVEKRVDGGVAVLARLGAGSIFGEMALLSDGPRGASVVCDTPAYLLSLTRGDAARLGQQIPQIAGAMARFTRDRMLANLMATNPIFAPFDKQTKEKLLAKFVGHEVPAGTIFIEQGVRGNGLYVLLQGTAQVLTWNGEEYIEVATLGPGDVAGEISLLHDEPATATVRTTSFATLLFLAKELFLPLVDAVPELLTHLAKLANERLSDTRQKLEADRLVRDGIEDVDAEEGEAAELTDDDIVLI